MGMCVCAREFASVCFLLRLGAVIVCLFVFVFNDILFGCVALSFSLCLWLEFVSIEMQMIVLGSTH